MAVAGVAGLASLVLIVRLWRGGGARGNGMFARRTYYLAVAAEVAAIVAVSALLRRHGLEAYFLQAVGVIVGLHFIGLWKARGGARFLGIAVAMCIVSLAAAALPVPLRDIATGLGNALVLWIGASLGTARR